MPQDLTFRNQSKNASKSLKEYRQLHRRVRHKLQNHHLKTLNSSSRPSTMRSMTRSRCPFRGFPEAPVPLQIKATKWPSANEIDACNGDLVVTITEVIAVNAMSTKNHLISPKDLLDKTLINHVDTITRYACSVVSRHKYSPFLFFSLIHGDF
jgi:hypothetical protein